MDTSNLTADQRRERMNVRNFLLIANREQLLAELKMAREKPCFAFKAECIVELIEEFDRDNPQHETPTRQLLTAVTNVLKHVCGGKEFTRSVAYAGLRSMTVEQCDQLASKLQSLADNVLLVELLTEPDYKEMP